MDWKSLAAKLAQMGLPVLGKAIGQLVGSQVPLVGGFIGPAGENIGIAAANMLADALGVAPDPVAIDTAIGPSPPPAIQATLASVEAEAKDKWATILGIAQAEEDTARTQILASNEAMKAEVLASSELPEGRWRTISLIAGTMWRPLFAYELLLECAYLFYFNIAPLFGVFMRHETVNLDMLPMVSALLLPYLASRFGLLGYHMNLRTKEKEQIVAAVTEQPKSVSLDDVKKLLKASGVKVK